MLLFDSIGLPPTCCAAHLCATCADAAWDGRLITRDPSALARSRSDGWQLVLALEARQHVVFVGDSGGGKTCILRALRRRLPESYFRLTYCHNATLLDRRQINVARSKLKEWLCWAARSRPEPFKKLAGTIRKHTDWILEYVRTGLSNGRVEGSGEP